MRQEHATGPRAIPNKVIEHMASAFGAAASAKPAMSEKDVATLDRESDDRARPAIPEMRMRQSDSDAPEMPPAFSHAFGMFLTTS